MQLLKKILGLSALTVLLLAPARLTAEGEGLSKMERTRLAFDAQQSNPGSMPVMEDKGIISSNLPKVVQGLGLCLALFFISVSLWKRKSASNPLSQRRLSVIESINVAPKTTLALVEVDGLKILLACGSESQSFFALSNNEAHDFLKVVCQEDVKLSA